MTRFTYLVRDKEGQLSRGELVAASRTAALEVLHARGSRPFSLVPIAEGVSWADRIRKVSLRDAFGPRSYDAEMALHQLALMHRNGLGLVSAVQAVGEQVRSKSFRKIMDSVVADLQDGKSLHTALGRHRVFPRVLIRLIEVGEATGELADALEQGARHMAQQRKRKATILSMLAYPTFVLTAAMIVSIYLVLGVIPKLQTFLTAMGRPLPAMTQSLLTFSQSMQLWAPTIGVATIAVLVSGYATYLQPKGRLWMDRFVLRLPVIGSIFRLSGTITFSSTLSALLRSGVSLVDALSAIENLHTNRYFACTVTSIRQAVLRGQTLSAPIARSSAYMPMLAQMLSIAERTGKTNEILEQVTDFHEEQLHAASKRLGAFMEPMLIVFIGGLVGYVYIAFFVALMSAGGNGR